MKRLILLFISVLFVSVTHAQLVNTSFENWVPNLGFENPEGWGTANNLVVLAGTSTTVKITDPSDGTYAALLQSKFLQLAGATVPGILTTGALQFDFATGDVGFLNGVAYTERPEKMTFDYKFFPGGTAPLSDTAGVFLVMTKYDAVAGKRDTIGIAAEQFTDTADTYEMAELDINYLSTESPDTLLIVFSSSITPTGAQDGTLFFVDNVGFSFATDITAPEQPAFALYPNPAYGRVTFRNDFANAVSLYIFDVLGREVSFSTVNPGVQSIDISALQKGVYLYQVVDQTSGKVTTGKLQVRP